MKSLVAGVSVQQPLAAQQCSGQHQALPSPRQVLHRQEQWPEAQGWDRQQKELGLHVGRGEMSGINASVKERRASRRGKAAFTA